MWSVMSRFSEEFVRAATAEDAIQVYYQALADERASDPAGTEVVELRRVATVVHSLPKSRGGSDGDGK